MTSPADTPTAAPLDPTASAEDAADALAFHLDYLDAKLTAIGEDFARDISVEHAHELHSAWDEVQQARGALDRLRARPITDPHPARSAAVVDFEEFTTRWDRATEPISALLSDQLAYAVAQWAAARTRYELAFVEAVRPATPGHAQRVERLDEAAVQLDRALATLDEVR
ncbi:MAG TPA: hypothetical protein VL551_27530 [Actinospica sp.]|jgi:hypothetical protein|nr:hypothetical protein [Actinospica sp.]